MSEMEDGTASNQPSNQQTQYFNSGTLSKKSDMLSKGTKDSKTKKMFNEGNIKIVESHNDVETQDSNRFKSTALAFGSTRRDNMSILKTVSGASNLSTRMIQKIGKSASDVATVVSNKVTVVNADEQGQVDLVTLESDGG